MSDNMRIWSKVEKTSPSATKKAKVGGMEITSLNGHHLVMKATEVFGPVGIGWGWEIVEERFDKGPEIRGGEGNREVLGVELSHVVRIKLWFKLDGERGEVEHYGCTPFLYKSKYGTTTDGEAPKKSLTDAIKKCLSMLGFSADVFLGLFDDQEYVAQRQDEEAIENAEDKVAEEERQKQERLDWIKEVLELMGKAPTAAAAKKIHDSAARRLNARKDDAGLKRIAKELAAITEQFEANGK